MISASAAFKPFRFLRTLLLCLGPLLTLAPPAATAAGLRILAYEPVVPEIDSFVARGQRKTAEPDAATVVLDAFGQRFTLELERNVRIDALLTADAVAYRGALEQNTRSWVRLTRRNGRFDALIWDGAELYVVAHASDAADALVPPLASPQGHLMFRISDTLIDAPGASCAIAAANDGSSVRGDEVYAELVGELAATLSGDAGTATRQLDLSVIADSLYREYAGSDQNAREEIAARLNNVDGIFGSQLALRFEVTSLDVHDARSDPLSTTTSPSLLLRELAQLRRSESALRATALTHLFTGRDFDGDAVGVAYIDTVCDAQLGAAITELRGRTTFFESLIAAHEIGHNLGAPHDGEEGPCLTTPQSFLMAPRINGNDAFSGCSLQQIESRLTRASCLRPVPAVDLSAATSTPSLRVLQGREALADFSVRNVGDGPASAVTAYVTTRHPGLEIVDAVASRGSCSISSTLLACQLGDLAADAAVDLTVTLLGNATGQGTATLALESRSADANAANDSVDASVSVEAGTDLVVALDAPASSEVGTEFEIAVEATNRSNLTASEVSLDVAVASGLEITAAASAGGQCTFSTADARCEHVAIDAGRQATATLTARANAVGNHRVDVSARSSELDLVPSDNEAVTRVAVAAQAGTGTGTEVRSSGGGGVLVPGALCFVVLIAALRRFSRTAQRSHRASDRA